ncbi:GGDEF domain-containing protein [Butyrivibrio sp. YAB3001]|uniref:GGDEF domain-containing protein n=1 Tax=Butyrivibrio sp. YAB3001 TaxID=1520812 RepID=UPI0008F663A5|nr:GGDEF domain-containing protein [Butyrivibrio sp. YAB3001]SFC88681.1 diguanylate cyclase (GGDEF) domain-containing protein [Butyrivibrio sp. YAB3001]
MRKYLPFLSLSLAIIAMVVIFLHNLYHFTPANHITRLSKDWSVTFRNEQYVNTNLEKLSNQVGSTFSKGDNITLLYTKPLNFSDYQFPYLMFKTQFCSYEIYLDDKMIVSNHTEDLFNYNFVGKGFNYVALPKDNSGASLLIKLFVTENNTRADIFSPMVGDLPDLVREIFHTAMYPAFTGVFLVIFGFVFLVISLLFYLRTSGVANQVICSLISIAVGIWMITAYDLTDFALLPSFSTTIEYGALYMVVPLMYILIYNLHKRYNNIVITFLGYTNMLFSLLFILLHLLNIVHINQFQKPYFLMSLIGLCLLVIYVFMDINIKTTSSSTKILMLGLTVLAFSLAFYAIVAINQKYVDYRQNLLLYFIIPSGSLFFVVTQMLNYFIFMTRSFAQKKEYASLTQIAYNDNLTGIPNRVCCDKALVKLDEGNFDFCILSLDLNGLKYVNDNSGHPAGDRLLKSFAESLTSAVGDFGECFRVGGDEFVVLFNEIKKEDLQSILSKLGSKLEALDKSDPEIIHSVSYGFAFRSEASPKDAHTVYMLADKRMYEYKRTYYSHLMRH